MADARESGVAFLACGHYATETFGVRRLGELLAERFGVEHSFIEWLDGRLDEITKRFGCLERKTWIFIDGISGDYEKGKPERQRKITTQAKSARGKAKISNGLNTAQGCGFFLV